MLPVGESALGALSGVGQRTIHPPWIETGDEPHEGSVKLQALLDSCGMAPGAASVRVWVLRQVAPHPTAPPRPQPRPTPFVLATLRTRVPRPWVNGHSESSPVNRA